MHLARIERHGDPDVIIQPKDRNVPRGTDHHKWSETPTYAALHQRLYKQRGKAASYQCGCGVQARQWSYTGQREKGVRLPLSVNLDDYEPMCVSCHKRKDLAQIAKE